MLEMAGQGLCMEGMGGGLWEMKRGLVIDVKNLISFSSFEMFLF
jgi:hypothetical protein